MTKHGTGIEWTPKQAYDRARYAEQRKRRLAEKAPDPIEAIGLEDRCYLAGLIDGEGSIYCGAIGPKRGRTCYPIVAMGMTDRDVIEWVASLWGVRVSYVLKRRNPRWLPQYFVRLSGKRAQILCRVLLPYLRVKKVQAELVCEFECDLRSAPGQTISEEANARRFQLRDAINSLNHKPRNPEARRNQQLDGREHFAFPKIVGAQP